MVIDNASTDGTLERLRTYGNQISLLASPENLGFARANNQVFRSDRADLYLLLNPDAYLTSDVISEILSAYREPDGVDIAGPTLVNPDGTYQTSAYAFTSPGKWLLQSILPRPALHSLLKGSSRHAALRVVLRLLARIPSLAPLIRGALPSNDSAPLREPVDWVTGACMLISGRVIEATGGFDDAFFLYCDDEELCFRAHQLGFKVERIRTRPVVHRLGWNANLRNPSSTHIRTSLDYMIRKNYADRPFRRRILLWMLKHRFSRSA